MWNIDKWKVRPHFFIFFFAKSVCTNVFLSPLELWLFFTRLEFAIDFQRIANYVKPTFFDVWALGEMAQCGERETSQHPPISELRKHRDGKVESLLGLTTQNLSDASVVFYRYIRIILIKKCWLVFDLFGKL